MSGVEARRVEAGTLGTAAVVALIVLLGNSLGFVRDLVIAGLFGASVRTDAFLVAWTVPEVTSTLLLEGAMVFAFVPLLTDEIQRTGTAAGLVRRSLLPLVGLLAAIAAVVAIATPLVVRILAPGLAGNADAVASLRWATLTILFLGTAGYMASVLRAHDRFYVAAAVYLAYNVGIIAMMVLGHGRFGVVSAAMGLAVGSALMVAVQTPSFLRTVDCRGLAWRVDRGLLRELAVFLPIGLFFFVRQCQVFVERFLGSYLAEGSISHLNFATKTAQVSTTLVLAIAVVSFPAFARAATAGDHGAMRATFERTVRVVAALILPASAILIVFAHAIVGTLYERGAFGAGEVSATATIMQIYAIGLIGQVLVSVAVQPSFATRRDLWRPFVAAAIGLGVTIVVDASLLGPLGARALALGNASGIITMALVLLLGARRQIAGLDLLRILLSVVRLTAITAVSVGIAWGLVTVTPLHETPALGVAVGAAAVLLVYAGLCRVAGAPEIEPVLDLTVRRLRRFAPAEGTRAGGRFHRPVPTILMYHSIGEPDADPHAICVSPERFAAQMAQLARWGYRGVAMRELLEAHGAGRDERLVGLTFDDGYEDFLTAAVPTLTRHGFTATVFVVAGALGGWNDWDPEPRLPLLDAEGIRAVAAAGMEVAAHSVSHPHLRAIAPEAATREVAEARTLLEAVPGVEVTGFAFPYGDGDDSTAELVRRSGYDYCCCTKVGSGDGRDPWMLPRRYVGQRDGWLRLRAKLIVRP
ncbi:MAG: lipid II flippase MurJ [Actinomycetes bacterium]